MIKTRKSLVVETLVSMGIYAVIQVTWRVLEVVEFGKIQPSVSDTIVGMLFAISLTENLMGGDKP